MTTRYSFIVRVRDIKLETSKRNWRKSESGPECDEEPIGYFLALEGSHESIFLGTEKPTISSGARVKITIEEVDDTKF